GGHPADRITRRHDARCAQFVDDAPEIEVLQRTLGQVLALRYLLQLAAALNERARHAPQPKIDRKRDPHRPTAHDDHLIVFVHASSRGRAYITNNREASPRTAGRRRLNREPCDLAGLSRVGVPRPYKENTVRSKFGSMLGSTLMLLLASGGLALA